MKIMKKATMLLTIVLLLSAVIPTALAAGDTSIEAGKTATLTFEFKDVFNVDGTFKVNDTDGIVSDYTIGVADAGATAAVVSGDRLWAAPAAEPVKTNVSVDVKVAVKDNADAGKACTVSFAGVYGDGNGQPGNEKDVAQSATITVKKSEVPAVTVDYTELKKQIGIAEGLENTGYAASDWNNLIAALNAAKEALNSNSQATVDAAARNLKNAIAALVKVDYAELQKQVNIAKGLKSTGYTTESWKNLTSALTSGKAALTSTSQKTVDAAAKALKDAIAALVKVDYTELQAAIKSVEQFKASEELIDLFSQLNSAVNAGKGLLTSGDQSDVDAAAARINELLEEMKKALNDKEPQTVIKEVEVEVLPKDDYCNIQIHRVWPVLFFVSLGLNAILVAAFVMMAAKKKKNAKDDTPLVDYDIGDDT